MSDNPHYDYSTIRTGAQDVDFRIDPEFQNKIPPISEEEFKQLRENILAAGEVYEPLVVWNGVLVDGHNRWKVIQESPVIKWRIRYIFCADKWEAFEWMYKNQLGRRNLTDEQRTYTIGKMLEARKQTHGGDRKSSIQSGNLKPNGRTAENIAHELGIGNGTVLRAGEFAKGVDALREVNPEAADKVLSGKAKVTKSGVASIAKMEQSDVEAAADAILADMAAVKSEPKKPKKNTGYNAADRELYRVINEAYKPMLDESEQEAYTVDDMADEITANGFDFVNYVNRELDRRKELLDSDAAREGVRNAIDDVIKAIKKVRDNL